ncbi:origin recognition complex ORC subunit 3 [Capsaspora owczarzaki ATCC 30864]|uniref:Origin recognition complex subunit 3 n=1 Tax=Capsaspora owczarzaki (strain ATCC 30864) TaxID=595528 RepID=A0A0D2UPG4_CAPO3|nr:origin recognition complex ORC subunit 3 [Capsaspora owczarzaki ATCC 30864]KJE96911.1 origin recognition complex ORC subunit 3 [Capsaspora owczarzaki ATCC 30864]|eukprot:XP_004343883.1 origin recognition complex ORC subunit 3 [Capsaspora owczarzaki ATCC 30864]
MIKRARSTTRKATATRTAAGRRLHAADDDDDFVVPDDDVEEDEVEDDERTTTRQDQQQVDEDEDEDLESELINLGSAASSSSHRHQSGLQRRRQRRRHDGDLDEDEDDEDELLRSGTLESITEACFLFNAPSSSRVASSASKGGSGPSAAEAAASSSSQQASASSSSLAEGRRKTKQAYGSLAVGSTQLRRKSSRLNKKDEVSETGLSDLQQRHQEEAGANFGESFPNESLASISLRYEAFQTCWTDVQSDIQNLLSSLNQRVFDEITSFLQQSGGTVPRSEPAPPVPSAHAWLADLVKPFEEVPTALLYAGVNVMDHSDMFAELIHQVKRSVSPHVILLQSKDCPNLRSLMRAFVEQALVSGTGDEFTELPEELCVDDDDLSDDSDTEEQPKTARQSTVSGPAFSTLLRSKRKVPNHTMETVQSWYDDKYQRTGATLSDQNSSASSRGRKRPAEEEGSAAFGARPPLVLVFSDFESFQPKAVQDFVLMCSNSRRTLPIVLLLGISTSAEAIHRLLPQVVFSRLKMEKFYLLHSSVNLTEILSRVLLSPRHPFQLGYRPLVALLENFLFVNFSINSFVRGLQFAMMEHFAGNPLSGLCLVAKRRFLHGFYADGPSEEAAPTSSPRHVAKRARSESSAPAAPDANISPEEHRLGLPADVLEQLRCFPSFQALVEAQQDRDEQRRLLLVDDYLDHVASDMLDAVQRAQVRFHAGVRMMHAISQHVPRWPIGTQLRELLVSLMSSADGMFESRALCNGEGREADDISLAEAYALALSICRIMSQEAFTACLTAILSALDVPPWMSAAEAAMHRKLLGEDISRLSALRDELVALDEGDLTASSDEEEDETESTPGASSSAAASSPAKTDSSNVVDETTDIASTPNRRGSSKRAAAALAKHAVATLTKTGVVPALPSAAIAASAADLPVLASMKVMAAASGVSSPHVRSGLPNEATKRRMALLQTALVQRKRKVFSRFERLRTKIVDGLDEILRRILVSPLSLPLHEAFYHQSSANLVRSFSGRARNSVHAALARPSRFIRRVLGQEHRSRVISTIPDTCIVYQLYRECGRLINLYDWLQAFAVVVDNVSNAVVQTTSDNDTAKATSQAVASALLTRKRRGRKSKSDPERSKEATEDGEAEMAEDDPENAAEPAEGESTASISPEIHARFIRAVSELQFMGFIKATSRKTDHVSKLTWGAL